LQWQFATARSGHGSLVLLAGEMGSGKTRLVREYVQSLSQDEAVVMWGSCYEGDWRPPYGPWIEALRPRVTSIDPATLYRALGPEIWSLLLLLPELRATWPDVSAPPALSQEQERLRLFDAIAQFLLVTSREKPLLLVFDDLHWADPDSLRLLSHVSHSLRHMRAMMVGIYRDAEPSQDSASLLRVITSLKHDTDHREIALLGLDRGAVADYLAHVLGRDAPSALVDTLYRETGGNPYYLSELLRHLLESGEVRDLAVSPSVDIDLRGPTIPLGIRQVLTQRVARLSEATRLVLRIAAACTRGFSLPLLQALTDLPESALLDCLDEALRAGFIHSLGGMPAIYSLSHAMVRHTLYNEWNPDRRLRLHRQIAQAMERVYSGREGEHAAELAAQYYASRELPGSDRGVSFALLAAEQASAAQGPGQAVSFLRMAIELAERAPGGPASSTLAADRAEIWRRLAVAEAGALLWDAVPETVEQALAATCDSGGDEQTCSYFLDTVVRVLQEAGAPSEFWDPLIDRGLELVGPQKSPLWARLTLLRSCLEPLANGPLRGGRWLGYDRRAVAILSATGDEDDYVRALDPLLSRTWEQTQDILRFAAGARRPTAALGALQVALNDLLYCHGDLGEALAVGERLLDASERYGSIPSQAEALAHLAGTYTLMGELSLGRDTWKRAHDLIARLGPEQPLRFREIEIGSRMAYVGGGDWAALAEAASDYLASPAATKGPFGLLAAAVAALCYTSAGRNHEAQSLVQWLGPLLEVREPATHVQTLAVAVAGAAVWELEDTNHAQTCRNLALGLLDAGAVLTTMGPLALMAARMAALGGDLVEAAGYFGRARELATGSGHRPFRAIADYDEARAFLRAGLPDADRAVAMLEAALGEFRALDMPDWTRRAQELLRQVTTLSARGPRSAGRKGVAHTPAYPDRLTRREVEVLLLVADGKTNQEIADQLVLSIATVQRHVANIYNKIDARNRSDATSYALRRHIMPPEPS